MILIVLVAVIAVAIMFYISTIAAPGEHPVIRNREWAKIFIPSVALIVASAAAYWAWKQFDLARDSAERQQRAYVMSTFAQAYDLDKGKTPKTTVWLQNFGQTPAANVTVHRTISLAPFPRTKPTDASSQQQTDYRVSIPPSGVRLVDNSLGGPLSDEELQSLQAGKLAIFLDIEIIYEDVFQKTRHTAVHLFRNGTIADPDTLSNTGEPEPFD